MTTHIRLALRSLLKAPWTTAAAILTLALGTGVNTTVLALAYGIVLRPLPYTDPSRLVVVAATRKADGGEIGIPIAELQAWRLRTRTLEGLTGYYVTELRLRAGDTTRVVRAALVTDGFFETPGVPAVRGRAMAVGDPLDVIVVSDRLARQTGVAPSAAVTLGGQAFTCVGVMPAAFALPSEQVDVWVHGAAMPGLFFLNQRDARSYRMVARLGAGVSLPLARDDAHRVVGELDAIRTETGPPRGVSIAALDQAVVGPVKPVLWVFAAAGALVLVVVCANVATMLVARTAARERELAVRRALGASRWGLLAVPLTESLLLAVAGSAFGLWLAYASLAVLRVTAAGLLPRIATIAVDGPAVLACTLVAMFVAALAGVGPGLHALRADAAAALTRASGVGAAGGQWLRGSLVAVQIGAAVVLLTGAGLFARTVASLVEHDLGFEPRGVLTLRLMLSEMTRFDAGARGAFVTALLEQVRALPGVRAAGIGGALPPRSAGADLTIRFVNGQEDRTLTLRLVPITPGYLPAIGARILQGRDLDAADAGQRAPRVLLSESLARHTFPNRDAEAVGKTVGFRLPMLGRDRDRPVVVGVVADLKYTGLDAPRGAALYLAWSDLPASMTYLAIRADVDPATLAAPIGTVIHQLDPSQPIADVAPLDDVMASSIADRRLRQRVAMLFAALAFLVSMFGIAAAMARTVVDERKALAIRLALGARPNEAVGLLVRRAALVTMAGLAIGVLASIAAGRGLATMLHGVGPHDPATLSGAVGLVLGAALLACYLPARRAARIDPVTLLRTE